MADALFLAVEEDERMVLFRGDRGEFTLLLGVVAGLVVEGLLDAAADAG